MSELVQRPEVHVVLTGLTASNEEMRRGKEERMRRMWAGPGTRPALHPPLDGCNPSKKERTQEEGADGRR